MAETFLSPIIEKLIRLLIQEAKSLKGVRREVESLKDELEIIEPFLKDAEGKSEKGEVNDAAKVWMKQIRKQAERIEDVVDEYLYHVERHRAQGGVIGSLRKAGRSIRSLKPRCEIASEIQAIKKSLREIKDRGVGYGLRPLEKGSSSRTTDFEQYDPRLRSLFMEEEEIVGIDGASEELRRRLIEGEPKRSVTSLVGQGGIGKTTLARKVYNDEVVKAHFDCHVWITVSQSYDMKKLLRITTRHVCDAGDRIAEDYTEEELIELLRKKLQAKRYLIVFDDVWDKIFWEHMKHALPNKDTGSRVIITTRNVVVANSSNENSWDLVKELQTWSPEMAWQLFCKKAFRTDEFVGVCPPELEQLSREIISKCHGLPLVISTMAGLLSTKERAEFEWRNVLNNLNLQYEETDILKIIYLSYLDLPYHLKLCFLYFGIFPEDFEINDLRLYKQWIAEGFVKEIKKKTLEDVAEGYLNELIQRNMVLFVIRSGIYKVCKVHDLMHHIIMRSAGDSCFCQTLNGSKSSVGEKSRRLSIHDTTENVLERVRDSKIRLPEEVGNLFHLKHLCLRGTKVKVLPKSIGKLQNLQTLDAFNTLVRELPNEVNKLRNLRHLLAGSVDYDIPYSGDTYCGVRIREGIGRLEELQTLGRVEVYPDRVGFVKELQNLSKLKGLNISNLTVEMGNALRLPLEKMNLLERLSLTIIEDEIFYLRHISSPPLLLRFLELSCRLQQLPNWISKLHNLQGVYLCFSRLIEEPLNCLKILPNLVFLHMYQTYEGEELHFEEGDFKKLKELRLLKLEGLKVVKIDRGALPVLETLGFGPFPIMKEMPSDIQHLTNLKSLRIFDMPREFVVRLQPDEGSDYWKIQHLPSVTFHYYRGKGFNYVKYKLGSSNLMKHLQGQVS